MNEPRCTLPECTDAAGTNVIDTWVAQQAAFVKGLDRWGWAGTGCWEG